MNQIPLFKPHSNPMNVVCFGSGTGSTLEALLEEQVSQEKRGVPLFRIRAVVVNQECRCIDIAQKLDIPLLYLNRKEYFSNHSKPLNDLATADEYDENLLQGLLILSQKLEFSIDFIALTGYSSILRGAILTAFHHRIINSHPADLSVRNESGARTYAGVYGSKAILLPLINGEHATKTCIHLVTGKVDGGEILVSSKPLKFLPNVKSVVAMQDSATKEIALKAIACYHQELQKRLCDFSAYITAINLIASGRLSLGDVSDPCPVFLDGKLLPYEGVNLEQTTI